MKWIKLFEAFTDYENTNDIFFEFLITKMLNGMDLKKVETKKYIYFYTNGADRWVSTKDWFPWYFDNRVRRSTKEKLEFAFNKEFNLLYYPDSKVTYIYNQFVGPYYGVFSSNNESLLKLLLIFGNLTKNFFIKYINVDFKVNSVALQTFVLRITHKRSDQKHWLMFEKRLHKILSNKKNDLAN